VRRSCSLQSERKACAATRGDRFWHAFGGSDKASAVHALRKLFERAHGLAVTIGSGDAPLDSQFLNAPH
jgi:predicted mannosyl-3-phosphoglycerate phosphatase (HAD superfamily)